MNPWISSGIYGLFLILYFRIFYRESVWNEVVGLYRIYAEKLQRMVRDRQNSNSNP